MKSNKQRYNDTMRQRGSSGGSNGNGPMWFIIFIALFAILASIYMVWNEGVLGKGDLNIGIGKPNPDQDILRERFR